MLNAGTSLGPYRIEAPLGAGGMGEVYRATDTRLGRAVAVKVIIADLADDPSRIRRFELEARAAGALNHPNLCTVFDVGQHADAPFVVMELLEGESLRDRLKHGPLPPRKAVSYAAQIARGLAAAHGKGIVHRDLKPANLFLTPDGRLKILDFGLAKLTRPDLVTPAGDDPLTVSVTLPGAVMGTMGYMAPEQVRGESADHRADIFALGAVLYEMLTGAQAFPGETFHESAYRILNEDPPPPIVGPPWPHGVEIVVRHCLEKTAAARYQDAGDLAFQLESLADGDVRAGAAAAPDAEAGARRPRWRTVPVLALASTLLAAAVVLAVVRHVRPGGGSPPAYTRLTAQRGQVGGAGFAPDGVTVVYAASWQGGRCELYATTPGYPVSRPLGLGEAGLYSIAPDGMMAVAVAGDSSTGLGNLNTLAVAPVGGGAPRRRIDGVRSADWLPGGETLAVVRTADGQDRLEVPSGNVLYRTLGRVLDVRVSPDGSWIAFDDQSSATNTRGSYAIVDRGGRVAARTRVWDMPRGAAWGTRGRELWYCANEGDGTTDLRGLTPQGRERLITRLPGDFRLEAIAADGRVLLTWIRYETRMRGRNEAFGPERDLQWYDLSLPVDISADGKWLVFTEQGTFGTPAYAACLRGMDGTPPVKLGPGSPRSISPDNRWVVTVQIRSPRLVLLPTGSGQPDTLPRGDVRLWERGMAWLPGGQGLVFGGAEEGRPLRTYVQDLKGGLPRPVTPEGVAMILLSPDGRTMVVQNTGDRGYLLWPRDGGEPRPPAGLRPGERPLRWSEDGQAVYCASTAAESLTVTLVDVETGRRVPWMVITAPGAVDGVITGCIISADGRCYAYRHLTTICDLYLVTGLE